MLSEKRPLISADNVLSCCTNIVGEMSPDRHAIRNRIELVEAPRIAERTIGSGLAQPKSTSSESIPAASALRQKCRSDSTSGMPVSLLSVAAPREAVASPDCGSRQWKRSVMIGEGYPPPP